MDNAGTAVALVRGANLLVHNGIGTPVAIAATTGGARWRAKTARGTSFWSGGACSGRPAAACAVGQRHHGDAFVSAQVQQVRIGGRHAGGCRTRFLGSDAVGQAHRPGASVVVPRPEEPCSKGALGVNRHGVGEVELGEVQRGVLLRGPHDADEVIDDLGEPNRG